MDKFDSQLSDMDVHASVVQDTMKTSTAELEPQDQVDRLLRQTAEEANIELQHDLAAKDISSVPDLSVGSTQSLKDEDDKLADRLRALRPVIT
jgi:charged multivesicular body protein 1